MDTTKSDRSIGTWLFSGCFLIYVMVMIGGITRLTGSGLSIVEWNLISGTLPPLSEEGWMTLFEKYKQFPEYQKINKGMTLASFKHIFFWEYLHRLLGRIVGIVFFIPFLIFYFKKQLNPPLIKKLFIVFLLGGLQGGIGWYMVKSGLVNIPHVSHYRLALHFITALFLLSFTFYLALKVSGISQIAVSRRALNTSKMITGIIVLQLLFGALMAGLKAGHAYNTFPDMNGELIPSGILILHPWWRNIFDNGITVQFIHRIIGFIIFILAITGLFYARRSGEEKLITYFYWFLGFIIMQIMLGILTLLFHVPVVVAVLHQAMAVLLLLISLFINFKLKVNEAG